MANTQWVHLFTRTQCIQSHNTHNFDIFSWTHVYVYTHRTHVQRASDLIHSQAIGKTLEKTHKKDAGYTRRRYRRKDDDTTCRMSASCCVGHKHNFGKVLSQSTRRRRVATVWIGIHDSWAKIRNIDNKQMGGLRLPSEYNKLLPTAHPANWYKLSNNHPITLVSLA